MKSNARQGGFSNSARLKTFQNNAGWGGFSSGIPSHKHLLADIRRARLGGHFVVAVFRDKDLVGIIPQYVANSSLSFADYDIVTINAQYVKNISTEMSDQDIISIVTQIISDGGAVVFNDNDSFSVQASLLLNNSLEIIDSDLLTISASTLFNQSALFVEQDVLSVVVQVLGIAEGSVSYSDLDTLSVSIDVALFWERGDGVLIEIGDGTTLVNLR